MTNHTSLLIMGFLLASFSVNAAAEKKVIPVISGNFHTGQWYFEGEESSLGGNIGLLIVPAIKYSDSFSLLPSFETNYRGTRSAEELAGGNTLFQDTWDTGIGLKSVWGFSDNWKWRNRIGLKNKWFRETTNETWSNGLYDYRTYSMGTEIGYNFSKKTTVALGYDFSLLNFPNYTSLESSQSGDTAREYAADNPLDTNIHLLSLRASAPLFAGIESQWQSYYSPRNYREQTIVLPSGLLSANKREDTYTGVTAAFDKAVPLNSKMILSPQIFYGYSSMDSNQNHYDARLTTFLANFYDYKQSRAGLSLSLAVARPRFGPMIFETGYVYSKRDYDNRLIQSANGNYLGSKLYITETAFNLGFSYPLSSNFRLSTGATFGQSKSNNQYEAVYRYNYDNASYQFGFTYDY